MPCSELCVYLFTFSVCMSCINYMYFSLHRFIIAFFQFNYIFNLKILDRSDNWKVKPSYQEEPNSTIHSLEEVIPFLESFKL